MTALSYQFSSRPLPAIPQHRLVLDVMWIGMRGVRCKTYRQLTWLELLAQLQQPRQHHKLTKGTWSVAI